MRQRERRRLEVEFGRDLVRDAEDGLAEAGFPADAPRVQDECHVMQLAERQMERKKREWEEFKRRRRPRRSERGHGG